MRKLSLALSMVAAILLALPAGAGAKKPAKHFSGQICPIALLGQLAALHIPDRCEAGPTIHTPLRRSALGGSLGSVEYTAKWGDPTDEPSHTLFISVGKEIGSAKAIRFVHKQWRAEVLNNGTRIYVLGLASLATETESCTNPPTDDCTTAKFAAVVGEYFLSIIFTDAPPTDEMATPSPGDDESEDNFQEAQVRAPVLTLAKTVMEKL